MQIWWKTLGGQHTNQCRDSSTLLTIGHTIQACTVAERDNPKPAPEIQFFRGTRFGPTFMRTPR